MEAVPTAADAAPHWRVLPLEVVPAAEAVGGGLALLEDLAADPVPALRWYRASSTAVVLGRGQALPHGRPGEPHGGTGHLPVLQRASGGGAVLLSPDMLCLDVALPAGHPLLDGDLAAVFLAVGRAWAAALGDLGVAGLSVHEGPAQARRRGSARERLLAELCFATLGRGEVAAGGRKLVGLSQRRRRPGALVQCGLLRRWRPEPLLAALGLGASDPGIERAAAGLDDLGVTAREADVVQAVSDHLTGKGTGDG